MKCSDCGTDKDVAAVSGLIDGEPRCPKCAWAAVDKLLTPDAMRIPGKLLTPDAMRIPGGIPVSRTDLLPFTARDGGRVHAVRYGGHVHVSPLLYRLMSGVLTSESAWKICALLDGGET